MKIALLGATGRTGVPLLHQALEHGHDVVAIVRNSSKLTTEHARLQVVEGDIFSEESLTSLFAGADAVLSCLGVAHTRKTTIYSDSGKAIVSAMRKAGVSRFVCITSWCTTYDRNDPGPWAWEWIYKPFIIGKTLADMRVMEEFLLSSECNDIDYTIVRPPELLKTSSQGKDILEEERLFVRGGKGGISRDDVAKFMLLTLTTERYNRKAIAIDSAK
ncbi:flavin reductase (NADPH)-like [Saccoglossus kowalevskii]|uniref:Flavin reductase (NADPH)-like n=1 Tax=Saccoglossus kowalevskii TaxID=10224 RepID=A0ABM0GLK3_SACKO|nr:PREDICTED: flavin reductase (NADPH)-like [Saccoglossus kowalevskii]